MTAIDTTAWTTEPAKVTEETILTVPASDVRKGDVLLDRKDRGTVGDRKVGTKRITTFDLEGKENGYFLLTDDVRVARTHETEESYAARQRAHLNAKILKAIENSKQELPSLVEEITKSMMSGCLTHWQLDKMVEAQSQAFCWETVENWIKQGEGKHDPYESAEKTKEQFTREIMNGGQGTRALSKSTSVTANLMDEALVEAKIEFCRDYRWMML